MRFKNSKNKMAYMYTLIPHGISSKLDITREFLKRRISEYNTLKAEIEELDKINKGLVTTSGRRMRVFVEKSLKEEKN